jgi:hypothetical protein
VIEPPSPFSGESEGTFNPVARWKNKMSPEQISDFEALVGNALRHLGYELMSNPEKMSIRAARLRATYLPLFDIKEWMRTNTPLARFVELERIEVEP